MIKPVKCWRGGIRRIKGNDQPLIDRSPLEFDKSQHGLIIARVAGETPNSLGGMRNNAALPEAKRSPLFVKPGQGNQSSRWADSTFF